MSRLENLIVSMVDLFEEYAALDGKKKISTDELKKMLEKELSSPELKEKILPEDINETMSMLDKNHDGAINFREFAGCVATLAKGYNKQKRAKGKKGKGKDGEQED